MNTSTVTPEIARFASGVRAALADLPADEVEDLTEGLEADLAESLAEDLRRTLPDPVAYAAELRLAAGLPGRVASVRNNLFGDITERLRYGVDDVRVAARRNPALAATLDLLAELRPAWWILRAVVAVMCVRFVMGDEANMLPNDLFDVLAFVGFIAVSVQWGRGRWHLAKGMAGMLLVGNVVAAALAVPVLVSALDHDNVFYTESGYASEGQDLTGVYLDGIQVTNIFGFDSKGRPLRNIQLFDQDGHPLATSVPGGNGCLDADCTQEGLWVPATLRNGTVAWNVFPLKMVRADYRDGGSLTAVDGAAPQARVSPFERVPALITPEKVADSNE